MKNPLCEEPLSRRVSFSHFSKAALDHRWVEWGWVAPNTFYNLCGLCNSNQFKPYAASKMEAFLTKK